MRGFYENSWFEMGRFLVLVWERFFCSLKCKIRIWTLKLGRASPSPISVFPAATWECVLEKREHADFKECIIWIAFTSVSKGKVHKSSEGRATLSFFWSLHIAFLLVWLGCKPLQHKWNVVFFQLQGFWHFIFFLNDNMFHLQVSVCVPEFFCVRVTASLFF